MRPAGSNYLRTRPALVPCRVEVLGPTLAYGTSGDRRTTRHMIEALSEVEFGCLKTKEGR